MQVHFGAAMRTMYFFVDDVHSSPCSQSDIVISIDLCTDCAPSRR